MTGKRIQCSKIQWVHFTFVRATVRMQEEALLYISMGPCSMSRTEQWYDAMQVALWLLLWPGRSP